MSNLSNLYISQSYFGVVNLADSTKPMSSQSGEVEFQDGLGESLELSINSSTKEYTFNNNVHMNSDLFVSGTIHAYELVTLIESASTILSSGSNQLGDAMDDEQLLIGQTTISGSLTVVGPHSHTGDLDVTGSLFVSNEISSSTIAGLGNATEYSQSVDSSLNILSQSVDNTINTLSESLDIQLDLIEDYTSSLKTAITVDGTTTNLNGDLNGGTASFDTLNVRLLHTTIESSSVIFSSGSNQLGDELIDTQILSGSVFIPNLEFLNGNLVDTDTRIVELENFSSSLDVAFVTPAEYSTSIAEVTSSLINLIDTKLDTGSYLIDSASFNSRIDNKLNISNFNSYTSSNDSKVSNLISATSSYARTDTQNIFSEIQSFDNDVYVNADIQAFNGTTYSVNSSKISFTGSVDITGSVNGNVENIEIISSSATIDCSLGNFFTLTLPTGSTNIGATNIIPGQTISIKVATVSGASTTLDSNIKMIYAAGYVPTQTNGIDILTFVTFDESSLYGVVGQFFG
jgi:hypothetical protein